VEVLLIDNNDSFTYNLAQSVMKNAGISLKVLAYQHVTDKDWMQADKIIISPGPGLPEDFPKYDQWLIQFDSKKPILGICMGQEIIACYYGAKLRQLKQVQHGMRKYIQLDIKEDIFAGLNDKIHVGLYHSWVVSNEYFPQVLKIIAKDEQDLVMGIAHKKYKIWALQFHPESYITDSGDRIIANFLR